MLAWYDREAPHDLGSGCCNECTLISFLFLNFLLENLCESHWFDLQENGASRLLGRRKRNETRWSHLFTQAWRRLGTAECILVILQSGTLLHFTTVMRRYQIPGWQARMKAVANGVKSNSITGIFLFSFLFLSLKSEVASRYFTYCLLFQYPFGSP